MIPLDLNSLTTNLGSKVVLEEATGVNNSGMISVLGKVGTTTHVFLLEKQ